MNLINPNNYSRSSFIQDTILFFYIVIDLVNICVKLTYTISLFLDKSRVFRCHCETLPHFTRNVIKSFIYAFVTLSAIHPFLDFRHLSLL